VGSAPSPPSAVTLTGAVYTWTVMMTLCSNESAARG
jgi:hypothetical protein